MRLPLSRDSNVPRELRPLSTLRPAVEYSRMHSAVSLDFESKVRLAFDGFLTNRLLTGLPGEDFARLLPHLEPISVRSGDQIYESGSEPDFAYFPETAVLSQVFILEDGSSTEAAIIGNEGMAGLSAVLDSRGMSYWTKVIIAGATIRLKIAVMREEFARGTAMQKLLLGYTSLRLSQLSQRAVCNGRHVLEERLCTWFLMLLDRTNEGRLALTHEEIGSHLGARRAGVTSICNALRDNGIIEYRRGVIQVLDRPRLESVACECYAALRAQLHPPLL